MSTLNQENEKKLPQAVIIEVINSKRVVINKGSKDGVKIGQKFLVYELSKDEVKDPFSGEFIGKIEYVKGIGNAIHVQEKLTTIEANKKTINEKVITKKKNPTSDLGTGSYMALFSSHQSYEEEIITPKTIDTEFDNPNVGDFVKWI